MALTIDELYERYMDIEDYAGEGAQEFAYDIYDVFGMGKDLEFGKEDWAAEYGMYLPSYDPTTVQLAERERIIDMTEAKDLWDVSKSAADRVYRAEQDTLRASLGKEIGKAREISGRQGLRTGAIESAVADTIETSSNRVKDLGDRYTLQNKADLDKYNTSMVDTTLDFDKSEFEAKEAFYDRTMAAIDRLVQKGAFAEKCPGETMCWNGDCSIDGVCAEKACEDDGMVTCGELGCMASEQECQEASDALTLTNCELDPTLPECDQFTDPFGDEGYIGPTAEMCQADPSLEGCGDVGFYEEHDYNVQPDEYNTCPAGYSGSYPNCYSIGPNSVSCTDPVCVAALWTAEEMGIDVMQMGQDILTSILGSDDPCYWTGDMPCGPSAGSECTTVADENGCRSCQCEEGGSTVTPGTGTGCATGQCPAGYYWACGGFSTGPCTPDACCVEEEFTGFN